MAISIVAYIVVKLVKTKPWVKERKLNLPLSYVNKIYGMKKTEENTISEI